MSKEGLLNAMLRTLRENPEYYEFFSTVIDNIDPLLLRASEQTIIDDSGVVTQGLTPYELRNLQRTLHPKHQPLNQMYHLLREISFNGDTSSITCTTTPDTYLKLDCVAVSNANSMIYVPYLPPHVVVGTKIKFTNGTSGIITGVNNGLITTSIPVSGNTTVFVQDPVYHDMCSLSTTQNVQGDPFPDETTIHTQQPELYAYSVPYRTEDFVKFDT